MSDSPRHSAGYLGDKGHNFRWGDMGLLLVCDNGIETVTSPVSGKRSPAELIARDVQPSSQSLAGSAPRRDTTRSWPCTWIRAGGPAGRPGGWRGRAARPVPLAFGGGVQAEGARGGRV